MRKALLKLILTLSKLCRSKLRNCPTDMILVLMIILHFLTKYYSTFQTYMNSSLSKNYRQQLHNELELLKVLVTRQTLGVRERESAQLQSRMDFLLQTHQNEQQITFE